MIEQIVHEIERCGYCFIPNVLNNHDLGVVNQFFNEHRSQFQAAMVGPKEGKQRVESIRGDHTYWLDPLDPPAPFLNAMTFLTSVKESLNAAFYLGLKQFECHLAYYPVGSAYKKHSDRFETSGSRSLSFVFYLNEKWDKEMGGELILYDKEDQVLKKINPEPGSFICFLSEKFPHEVKAAAAERRSLTGWMHTKNIY